MLVEKWERQRERSERHRIYTTRPEDAACAYYAVTRQQLRQTQLV
jgi:hypothetical protein